MSSLLSAKPADQDVPMTCAILAYEIGDAIKCALNQHWGDIRGYQGEFSAAMGDAVTMIRLLCEQTGSDFASAVESGERRYLDKMAAVRASGRASQ